MIRIWPYTISVKYIFATILLIITVLETRPVEMEIPYRELSSNVKSVEISRTTDKDEPPQPVKKTVFTYFGAKKTEHLYNDDGSLKWTIYYEYRNNNIIVSKQARKPNGEVLWRTNFEYNSNNRLLKKTTFNSSGQPDYTTVYEHQADRTEVLAYGADGSLQWRKKIVTPKDGNTRGTYFYYPEGTRIKVIVEDFNSYGETYEEIHIDEIGTVFRRIENEYDIFGRMVGRIVYNDRGDVHRRVWVEYLPHGHIGLVRQVVPAENRVEEHIYSYKIDNRGSWTYRKEIVTIKDETMEEPKVITRVETRDIEYFSEMEQQE